MSRAITDDEAELTALGVCLECRRLCTRGDLDEHDPCCSFALGLGTARGVRMDPGEACARCHRPIPAGDRYDVRDGDVVCLACSAGGAE